MEKINLKQTDTYEVLLKSYLSDYDRKILNRLYQPLCGAQAIALFNSLWSELEFDKTISLTAKNHTYLLDTLGCTLPEFVSSRKKLEGLGLLKTLYKNGGQYLYLLYAPKSPKEFFDYELFDALLKNKIGEEEYERVRTYFSLAHYDDSEYIDISQNFTDVYVLNVKKYTYRGVDDIIGHDNLTPITTFDFSSFYSHLKDYFIKTDSITKEMENEIALLATTYNLGVDDMVNVVYRSLDSNGKIDLMRLKKYARLNLKNQKIEIEENCEKTDKTGSESVDKDLKIYNLYTPLEFLRYRSGNHGIVERDARLINNLSLTTNLPSPVINALIDYCLKNNENRLTRNYLEALAGGLMRSNITDAYEAMIYLNKDYTDYKKKPKVKVKKEEPKVDPDDEISDEEFQESLRILEELKKGRKTNG